MGKVPVLVASLAVDAQLSSTRPPEHGSGLPQQHPLRKGIGVVKVRERPSLLAQHPPGHPTQGRLQ